MRAAALSVLLFVQVLPATPATPAMAAPPRLDPERTMGPEACARCHDKELEVWKGTAHAKLYAGGQPLHLRPRAQQIAKSMGERLIKNDSRCLSCHFTPQALSGRVTAQAGVSCEHCHGAARDWITVHNTFDGRQVNRATESAEQRRARQERNAKAGMRGPGNLYDLLSSCYRCHLVPDEKLVNVGGHSSGGELDLPARFEKIRHNFVTGGRKANAPTTPEHRRQLYVLGLAIELEQSLRGLAEAKEEGGDYASLLAERAEDAKRQLQKAQKAAPGLPFAGAVTATDGLRLAAGNGAELSRAIEKVSAAARGFTAKEDGSRLAALDLLLQEADEPDEPEAQEQEEVAGAAEPAEEAGPASSGTAGTSGTSGTASAKGTTGGSGDKATTTRPAAGTQGPAGERRAHLRSPLPSGAVKGPRNCAGCHRDPATKWKQDKHYRTAEPFQNGEQAPLRIATLYYGKPANDLITTGQTVCMDCHGTVKGSTIDAGVSCESCHGPAGKFFEPHKTAANRAARLQAGIVDLEDAARRAEVCASCHYITDPRLLASGHPVPKRFDLAARSEQIRHWKGGPDGGTLNAAFQQAIARRGAVPQVKVAKLDETAATSAAGGAGPAATAGAGSPGAARPDLPRRSSNGLPPAPRPYGRPAAGGSPSSSAPMPDMPDMPETPRGSRSISLPPLPEGIEKQPVPEILRQLQQRLEALYRQIGDGG